MAELLPDNLKAIGKLSPQSFLLNYREIIPAV
jgi:hypothetical protein